ncbi:MAG TPA: hypothetical protein VIR54_11225 [Vicinamibacterales bacterium]
MAKAKNLAEVKRAASETLLNHPGVSGLGLRGDGVVVYLESDDPRIRQEAERVVEQIAPSTPVYFELTGRIGKQ